MNNPGITERLAKGATWIAAGRLVMNASIFINTLILARLLGPDDFGLVAIATTILVIVNAATQLSLDMALIQRKHVEPDHFHTVFTMGIARSSAIGLILAGLSFPIGAIYGDPRLGPVLIAIAASTTLTGLYNPKVVVLARRLIFWHEFVISIAERAANLMVALAVAIVFRSYWALVAGVIAGQLVLVLVSYVLVPYAPRLSLGKVRELLSFSIWLTLGQMLNTLVWRLDNLAVGFLLGNAALGIYTVGDRLAAMPTQEATAPVAKSLFPGFTKLQHDRDAMRAAYLRAQSFLTVLALPLGCGLAVVADPLVRLAMSDAWLGMVPILQILASIFALQTLGSSVRPLAMALGHTRALFNRDVVTLVIRVPAVLAGLLTFGLPGLLVARCATGLIGTMISMMLVSRLLALPMRTQLAANMRSLAGAGVMVAGVCVVGQALGEAATWQGLLAKIAVMVAAGAAIYALCLLLLWRLMGCPEGPEREGARITAMMLGIGRRPWARAS